MKFYLCQAKIDIDIIKKNAMFFCNDEVFMNDNKNNIIIDEVFNEIPNGISYSFYPKKLSDEDYLNYIHFDGLTITTIKNPIIDINSSDEVYNPVVVTTVETIIDEDTKTPSSNVVEEMHDITEVIKETAIEVAEAVIEVSEAVVAVKELPTKIIDEVVDVAEAIVLDGKRTLKKVEKKIKRE